MVFRLIIKHSYEFFEVKYFTMACKVVKMAYSVSKTLPSINC